MPARIPLDDSKQAVLLIRRPSEIKRVLLCSALQCLPSPAQR